jgi:hypothetical protein
MLAVVAPVVCKIKGKQFYAQWALCEFNSIFLCGNGAFSVHLFLSLQNFRGFEKSLIYFDAFRGFTKMGSASKVLEKNTILIIKMASESDFKTIQQLTCFVMNNRVKSIFFTSDFVFLAFYACPHQKKT